MKANITKTADGKLRFNRPKDQNGKFLPMSKWSDKEIEACEEVKQHNNERRKALRRKPKRATQRSSREIEEYDDNGHDEELSSNPIRYRERDPYYYWPRDNRGKFLPKSYFSEEELTELQKAKDMGLFKKTAQERERRKKAKKTKAAREQKKMMQQWGPPPMGGMAPGGYPMMFQQPIFFPPPYAPYGQAPQGPQPQGAPLYPPSIMEKLALAEAIDLVGGSGTLKRIVSGGKEDIKRRATRADDEEVYKELLEKARRVYGQPIGFFDPENKEEVLLGLPPAEIADYARLIMGVRKGDVIEFVEAGDIEQGEISFFEDVEPVAGAPIYQYAESGKLPAEKLGFRFTHKLALEKPLSKSGKRKLKKIDSNPYSVAALVEKNNKKTLGERVVHTVDYFRDRPLLMLAGLVAAVMLAYKGIKYIENQRSKRYRAVEITEKVLNFPGAEPYELSALDGQWLANSLWAYVGTSSEFWSSKKGWEAGSAVLWTLVNRFMTAVGKREEHETLASMIASDLPMASSHAIDWDLAPPGMRKLVKDFAVGFVPNTVGTRTAFTGKRWGYMPFDSMAVGSVVVWTEPGTHIRPDARA